MVTTVKKISKLKKKKKRLILGKLQCRKKNKIKQNTFPGITRAFGFFSFNNAPVLAMWPLDIWITLISKSDNQV